MKEGLLWFDANSRVSPNVKLAAAAARFAERFGRPANTCHVHPSELFTDPEVVVVPDPAVLPRHLWVGYDEALAPAATRSARRARRRTA